jgi:hypothetical protein
VIWELSDTERSDDGQPVVFEWTGMLENTGAPVRIDNVTLDITVGLTPDPEADPMVAMAYSSDDGQTLSAWMKRPLGRQGVRATRVLWPKLCLLRQGRRLHLWKTTEPVTVRKAKYNQLYH